MGQIKNPDESIKRAANFGNQMGMSSNSWSSFFPCKVNVAYINFTLAYI